MIINHFLKLLMLVVYLYEKKLKGEYKKAIGEIGLTENYFKIEGYL